MNLNHLQNHTHSIIRDHAMLFLRKRGITEQDIERYNLGYCVEGEYQNRIIIPSYDSNGKLNYFVGRDFYYASTLKYKNPPIPKDVIGFDLYVNWSLPIILVEGVFDAMIVLNPIPYLCSVNLYFLNFTGKSSKRK